MVPVHAGKPVQGLFATLVQAMFSCFVPSVEHYAATATAPPLASHLQGRDGRRGNGHAQSADGYIESVAFKQLEHMTASGVSIRLGSDAERLCPSADQAALERPVRTAAGPATPQHYPGGSACGYPLHGTRSAARRTQQAPSLAPLREASAYDPAPSSCHSQAFCASPLYAAPSTASVGSSLCSSFDSAGFGALRSGGCSMGGKSTLSSVSSMAGGAYSPSGCSRASSMGGSSMCSAQSGASTVYYSSVGGCSRASSMGGSSMCSAQSMSSVYYSACGGSRAPSMGGCSVRAC